MKDSMALHRRGHSWASTLLALLVLLLTSADNGVNAYLLKSTGTGGLATGFIKGEEQIGDTVLIVGTLYTDEFWQHSFPPADSPRCMIIQADTNNIVEGLPIPKSVQVPLDVTPQICVGGGIRFAPNSNGQGAVMGTWAGHKSSLQILNQLSTIDSVISATQKLDFPDDAIPVASAVGHGDDQHNSVFVALMGTQGEHFQRSDNPIQDLRGLVEYWDTLTQPPISNTYLEVIHYDYQTQVQKFETQLQVVGDGAGAVISSIVAGGEGTLIVAGSTNGAGDAFGLSATDFQQQLGGQVSDWDGYLTFLNAETGALTKALRIASQPGKNDFIHAICMFGSDLYIVGTTEGHMTDPTQFQGGAFLLKMNWQAQTFEYKLTIPLLQTGVACTATQDGVYVGFYVTQETNPEGGSIQSQDVVITKFAREFTGQPNDHVLWSQWLDTTMNAQDIRQDYLVGMQSAAFGNIMILMNSMNLQQGVNDILVVELDKETGQNDLTGTLPDRDEDPQSPTVPQLGGGMQPTPTGNNAQETTLKKNPTGGVDERKATIWVAVAIPIFLAISVLSYHCASNTEMQTTTSRTVAQGTSDYDHNNDSNPF